MVQLGLQRVQTDFDVSQTHSVGQLSKSHAEKLIEAREPANAIIAAVFENAAFQLSLRQEGHELGEEKLPGMHCQVLSTDWRGKDYQDLPDQVEIDAG